MDAFTENILVRARERQKMLEGFTGAEKVPSVEISSNISQSKVLEIPQVHKESLSESNHLRSYDSSLRESQSENNSTRFSRQNSKTRVSSDMPGSPRSQLKTLNIQQDNFNMEIKVSSTENVRVEVEIAEAGDTIDNVDHKSESGLRDESKSKLKRLGKLYSGGDEIDISSPIHKTEAKFSVTEDSNLGEDEESKNNPRKFRKGLSKLASLAETINQWEDEISPVHKVKNKSASPKKTWKPPAPQPPPPIKTDNCLIINKSEETKKINSRQNIDNNGTIHVAEAIPKKLKWDPKVLDTLESQGFSRTDSCSRLVYAYNSPDQNIEVKTAQKMSVEKEHSNLIHEEDEVTENDTNSVQSASVKNTDKNNIENSENLCPSKISKVNKVTNNGKDSADDKPMKFSPKINLRSGKIANRAAAFESSPTKSVKDPALLSVSERKALFEKNRGEALLPKAAFGMSHPWKIEAKTNPTNSKITSDNNGLPSLEESCIKTESPKRIEQSPPKTVRKPSPKAPTKRNSPTIAVVHQAGGIASKMAALLENKSTISQEQIEKSIRSERQKEMNMLLNRFDARKEVANEIREEPDEEITETTAMIIEKPSVVVNSNNGRRSGDKRKSSGKPYSKEDSPKVVAVLDDYKRIRISPPKPARLYPNLSDIEASTETETDANFRSNSPDDNTSCEENTESDDPNTSFGRDILEAVCKNQTPQKRPIYDESTASDVSSILDDMDNYLEEFNNEEDTSAGPTPPKQVKQVSPKLQKATQPSNSFNYKNFSPSVKEMPKNQFQSPIIKISPQPTSDLPEYVLEGNNVLPLTHTVSIYRRQQTQVQSPMRQVSRQPILEESESGKFDKNESEVVNKKIEELQEEVNKQQNIISQTSQALNLCSCTPEFSGSTEQVEAERVLLVATHRRQAAIHELQRLKVERTIRPQGQHANNVPLEKGTLTISDIILPLKHKYVKALAAAGGKGHHVVCLIKCGEQVVPTKLVSTVVHNTKNPDTDLRIPGDVVLNNIYSDFTVTFEVYCLQAQEEFLPHEVKYHINKKSGNKLVTPKKSKQESRMIMPIRESPAGPHAVRTSSFAVMGYIVFSVQAVNKKIWSLNNTPSMSPLDGTVQMRICCELAVSVEHRGFLTMFEDVAGFGAWHRRWVVLKGDTFSYWKYPDDEKKMAPIDTIDLKNCITQKVGPVSRDICARLHTFLIERERVARPKDKDSLVTICKGDKTIIRHLLSADTKDDRIQWCDKFNAALTALRMWGSSRQ
ncbi:anillin, actin binding protein [Leptinotarsa decemlineata]|uniref:anillin, actin binding protein n=1 Tax=Leptinotarsa decemlineata TaxID=7539 RepID=UPI003D30A6DD